MATTTNYGWDTPDDTDLVKDGASAIRTLGSSIDTTVKNLNPETTLGDISYRSSTANTNTRLGIGTTGQVLTVSGGVPAWSTPSAGAYTVLASGSLAAAQTGLDLTSISGSYTDLQLFITDISTDSGAGEAIHLRVNNDSNTNYSYYRFSSASATASVNSSTSVLAVYATTSNAATDATLIFEIKNYADTTSHKIMNWAGTWASGAQTGRQMGFGSWTASPAAIDRITMSLNAGTFDNGSYILYGVK